MPRKGPKPKPLAERFWAKVEKTDGCWWWRGQVNGSYGAFHPQSQKTTWAHRQAYILQHGPIPEGMCVCHACDNPLCVRGDHLWLGTQKDNVRDAMAKGRYKPMPRYPGEKNAQAKLTEAQILAAFDEHIGQGTPIYKLARGLNVSKTAISFAFSGRTWGYLQPQIVSRRNHAN